MAEAVEKAEVVLVGLSRKYKESTNCRTGEWPEFKKQLSTVKGYHYDFHILLLRWCFSHEILHNMMGVYLLAYIVFLKTFVNVAYQLTGSWDWIKILLSLVPKADILKLFNFIWWGWPWFSVPSSHIFKSVSVSPTFPWPIGYHAKL